MHERFLVFAILVVGFLAAGVWEPWTLVSCLRSTTWVALGAVIALWGLKGTYGVMQALLRRLSASSSSAGASLAPAAGVAVAGGTVLVMSDDVPAGAEPKVADEGQVAGEESVGKEAKPEISPRDVDRDVGTGDEPGDAGVSGERKE